MLDRELAGNPLPDYLEFNLGLLAPLAIK